MGLRRRIAIRFRSSFLLSCHRQRSIRRCRLRFGFRYSVIRKRRESLMGELTKTPSQALEDLIGGNDTVEEAAEDRAIVEACIALSSAASSTVSFPPIRSSSA